MTMIVWCIPCVLSTALVAEGRIRRYGLPPGAHIVETQSLARQGYENRALVLWMLRPQKHPREDSHAYTCPEETTGSFYSGPTRVSLIDLERLRIINTISVRRGEYFDREDTFDIPYRIHAGSYYHVPGTPKGKEGKPKLMELLDYNGDGNPLEFALYEALACMGLPTALIGYSERQDRVIQYQIRLRIQGEDGRKRSTSRWCDYLFSIKPCAPGHWRYEIDYRGRGGSLDTYDIRYSQRRERFEGRWNWTTETPSNPMYWSPPRRCPRAHSLGATKLRASRLLRA